ncbi:MAG: ABC transporter permease [Vulcanibacillus sp.]
MGKSLRTRLIEYSLTFLFILSFNFFIPRLMPGDPFTFISSEAGDISISFSDDEIDRYNEYYGLDEPLYKQYTGYLRDTFTGNFGYSIYYHDNVLDIILKRMWWTFGLVISSLILSSVIGVILGSISAWNRNNKADYFLYLVLLAISEIPSFLLGILFLFVFSAKFGFFPLSGGMGNFVEYNSFYKKFLDIAYHAALPIITLTIVSLGGFYILARNSMITVLSKDYIKTARAKGLSKKRQIFRHALRNSILPLITRIFLSIGTMFGGAILIENVFNYPGLGRLMRDAVLLRDYPLIQGIFLFITVLVLFMNFLADIVYKKLDPRVK